MGQPFVKTEPRDGTTALMVEAPCRFVVLPDFFADNIVIDAAELSVARAELPSENFPAPPARARCDRDDGRQQSGAGREDRIGLPAAHKRRFGSGRINRSQMFYGPGGKIWVAVSRARASGTPATWGKGQAGKVMGLD